MADVCTRCLVTRVVSLRKDRHYIFKFGIDNGPFLEGGLSRYSQTKSESSAGRCILTQYNVRPGLEATKTEWDEYVTAMLSMSF